MAPALAKSLSRLTRDSLVNLCLEWSKSQHSVPYLTSNRNLFESDEEDYLHEPAENRQELLQLYKDIKQNSIDGTSLSKRDIIDRIVDGDWRRGLSLHQLATIDFAYLEQNDTALRWTALKLVPLISIEDETRHPSKRRKTSQAATIQPCYPQVAASAFVTNLRAQITPLVKAHYTLHRLSSPSKLTVLRLYIVPNTAFAPSRSSIPKSPKEATDSARVMYIALPDSCPYVYISLSGGAGSGTLSDPKISMNAKVDITTTKKIVLEAIPKALSKPQERWSLQSTKLTTRSLTSMCLIRGNDRPGTGGGAYAKFSEEYGSQHSEMTRGDVIQRLSSKPVHNTPLYVQLPTPPPEEISTLQLQVHDRFGQMSGSSHASLNRFQVKLTDIVSVPPYKLSSKASQTTTQRKRKRLSLEDIENGVQNHDVDRVATTQVQQSNESKGPATISLSFSGSDVFAGLKQLALLGEEYVDLSKMPSWATGEKSVSVLTV